MIIITHGEQRGKGEFLVKPTLVSTILEMENNWDTWEVFLTV